MSLLTEAQRLAKRPGGTCGVARLALSPEERAELAEAMAADVSAQAISDALKARGHELPAAAIRRHRQGACACP